MKILSSLLVSLFPLIVWAQTHTGIVITGVDEALEKSIQTHLQFYSATQDLRLFGEKALIHKIEQVLQTQGYYRPTIQSFPTSQGVFRFHVMPGRRILVMGTHFHMEGPGALDPTLETLSFPMKKGDAFVHTTYEDGKALLLSQAIQKGYLNATFTQHRVALNTDDHTAEIFLTLDPGLQYTFGPVSFKNTYLSHRLLTRYLPFEEGEPYKPEQILLLQSSLSQSGYFSSVNVTPLPDQSLSVPIEVALQDANSNIYWLGLGFSTDSGFRGKVGWKKRYANSLGHQYAVSARIAQIYNKFEVNYIIPGKHPVTDRITLKGGFSEDLFNKKRSKIYELGICEERNIHGWQRGLALDYRIENYTDFPNSQDRLQKKLILPSVTLLQIKRNSALNPTRGRRVEIHCRGSINALASDASFLQGTVQLRWLHTFHRYPSLKALIRTEWGATLPQDLERLPLSQRFFAGGDLSIRGYKYRALPPLKDDAGNPLPEGGTWLGFGSIEIMKTIRGPFGVSTFVDAGNAFRRWGDPIFVGTGIGVEWQTPAGPIKIAFAKPLNQNRHAWRIHLLLGPQL